MNVSWHVAVEASVVTANPWVVNVSKSKRNEHTAKIKLAC